MNEYKEQKPGSKGCLWHWASGNTKPLSQAIETPGPEAKINPLTQKATE